MVYQQVKMKCISNGAVAQLIDILSIAVEEGRLEDDKYVCSLLIRFQV